MTQLSSHRLVRRGRIFPESQLTPEEKARREAEQEVFFQRCRVIFEQVRPNLIGEHYNWFIFIELDSGDYIIDPNRDAVLLKGRQKHPQKKSFIFRLNETGICGTIL
ncbi:hypothetical protein [Argonema antarcticum]|uniref:hypothetical protein n=1 Tax=Argonema antarcticum TaxID=2942763 RepID=UPI002012F2FC|nr:hypothetical protein [Argonema antarcticum]MCL1474392.1 hypothetical protein [Argonema antarcticum A004/B2]